MAPPTVFSYLRRDHRRSSPPAASPTANSSASPVNVSLHAPISYSPNSGTSIEPLPFSESQTRYQPNPHTEKNRGRTSFTPLELPSSIHEPFESYWAPENGAKSTSEAVASSEPPELLRPDVSHGGPNKPTSPWRLSFGKVNIPDNSKGGTTATGGSSSGYVGRGRRSFENEPSEQDGGFMKDPVAASTIRREGMQDGNTEMGPSRHGKTRLNLLNPMALLARRRSGQVLTRAEEVNIGKMGLPALPDDYDPRIRGKLFHDFSAPRPKPNVPGYTSHQSRTKDFDRRPNAPVPATAKASQNEPGRPEEREQVYEKHNDHAPLFREHFEDDRKALQVDSKGYLESLATSKHTPSAVPPFAKQLPVRLPSMNEPQEEHIGSDADFVAAKPKSRTPTIRDKPPPVSAVPRRFTSNASRFSFDLAGVDSSSQERIMEEKHKEREAARRANAPPDSFNDFDSDEFDYDAMMDDDGLEERIPGVNADADDYGDVDESMGLDSPNNLASDGNKFLPVLPTVVSAPMSPLNLNSPAAQPHIHAVPPEGQVNPLNASSTLDANGNSLPVSGALKDDASMKQQSSDLTASLDDDDDLYFDDGLIDDILPDTGGDKFDESIFDDPNSHLYERKKRNSVPLNTVLEEQAEHNISQEEDEVPSGIRGTHGTVVRNRDILTTDADKEVDDTIEEQPMHDLKSQQPVHGLTEGNLEAYHSALAQAANEAALNGRFRRSMSESDESADSGSVSPSPDSHPDLTADESRISQNIDSAGFEEDVFDDFDYEDAGLDDDLIIAAANAEALENDDEGFYGEEFGFYAYDHGNCESERVLGGYFGPRRVEGVTRSHSGRINFQEPSLTPITERSEWSTRNSIISLSTHAAHSNPAVASPALAQLVDMGNLEDEMTLSSLMRLRRGAWGGSNGSLRSSAASQGGTSPQSHQPSSNLGSFTSFHDVIGEQSRSSSALANAPTGSQDVTQSENVPPALERDVDTKPLPPIPNKSEDRRPPPLSIDTVKANVSKPGKDDASHSRTSSVAESISYVKETDESGINCWVLEKRRTGESGEFEVFEREPLTSGRI